MKAILLCVFFSFFLFVLSYNPTPGVFSSCYGDCSLSNEPPINPTEYGLSIIGGGFGIGTDQAMSWLFDRCGNGHLTVISAAFEIFPGVFDPPTGCDLFLPSSERFFNLSNGSLSSVTTFCFTNRTGSNNDVMLNVLKTSGCVYLSGGSEALPTSYLSGSKALTILQNLINEKKIPFGGSSAGMMLLGEVVSNDYIGGPTSDEALLNPYFWKIDLLYPFLSVPQLQNSICDTHFEERDRMGRLIVYLARIMNSNNHTSIDNFYGVAASEATGILINKEGKASFVGEGGAYILYTDGQVPLVCQPNVPLTYNNINIWKRPHNDSNCEFDFNNWVGTNGINYQINVINGNLISTQPNGSIY